MSKNHVPIASKNEKGICYSLCRCFYSEPKGLVNQKNKENKKIPTKQSENNIEKIQEKNFELENKNKPSALAAEIKVEEHIFEAPPQPSRSVPSKNSNNNFQQGHEHGHATILIHPLDEEVKALNIHTNHNEDTVKVRMNPTNPKIKKFVEKFNIQTNVPRDKIKSSTEYSKDINNKYNCPICLNFFNYILKLSCCKNYICLLCAEDYLETCVKYNYPVNCPFCGISNTNILLDDVIEGEPLKFYSDIEIIELRKTLTGRCSRIIHLDDIEIKNRTSLYRVTETNREHRDNDNDFKINILSQTQNYSQNFSKNISDDINLRKKSRLSHYQNNKSENNEKSGEFIFDCKVVEHENEIIENGNLFHNDLELNQGNSGFIIVNDGEFHATEGKNS